MLCLYNPNAFASNHDYTRIRDEHEAQLYPHKFHSYEERTSLVAPLAAFAHVLARAH